MMNEIRRETVQIGLDFRPIPIDLGDGTEWLFNPDPDPTSWSVLTDAMTAFGKMDKDDDGTPNMSALPQLTEQLTKALAGLLVDAKQGKDYVDRAYGVMAQQKLAVALLEASGFPTQSP